MKILIVFIRNGGPPPATFHEILEFIPGPLFQRQLLISEWSTGHWVDRWDVSRPGCKIIGQAFELVFQARQFCFAFNQGAGQAIDELAGLLLIEQGIESLRSLDIRLLGIDAEVVIRAGVMLFYALAISLVNRVFSQIDSRLNVLRQEEQIPWQLSYLVAIEQGGSQLRSGPQPARER
ncbi:hypothetical protein D3C80_1572000 [compost metagenome]